MNSEICQDWEVNRGNYRSGFVLAFFRLVQAARKWPEGWRWLALPLAALYEVIVVWLLGIELNHKATVGPRLRLYHGVGLVVHEAAVIGADCTLRHCTTIGVKNGPDDCPVLGNNVDAGSNAVIMGKIRVGDGAKIGAGSVVIHDVAAGDVVAGNPARSIKAA